MSPSTVSTDAAAACEGEYPSRLVTPGTAPRTFRERAVDVANLLGERFLRWLECYFARHSLVGDHTFFDPADFAWVARLEAGAAEIRAELDEVLRFHATSRTSRTSPPTSTS